MVTFVLMICTLLLIVLCLTWLMLNIQKQSYLVLAEELRQQIAEGNFDIDRYVNELEYRKTWDFIIAAAIEMGAIAEGELAWYSGSK